VAAAIFRDRATTALRDARRLAAARLGAAKFEVRYRASGNVRVVTPASLQRGPRSPAPRTPPSSVFLPNEEKLHALDVGGTRAVSVGDRQVRLVELRGWLRAVDPVCKASDPAWYYLLEPDLEWSEASGLRPSDILRVGNIVALGDSRAGASPWRIESRPLIRIEFGGWDEAKLGIPPPDDWRSRGSAGCPGVFFAFDPLRPVPGGPVLEPGRYVRVVGSLVSDAPHATKATAGVWLVRNLGMALDPQHVVHAAENAWSRGGEESPDNPARWTEIHPPDLIEPLPDRDPQETVRGVTVHLPEGAFSRSSAPMDLSLAPPGPRPAWARGIAVRETILDAPPGSPFQQSLAACRLDDAEDRVQIRIDLKSGEAESLAAIFRVAWSRDRGGWWVVKPSLPASHPPGRGNRTGAVAARAIGGPPVVLDR
jgi:hypothetical protein